MHYTWYLDSKFWKECIKLNIIYNIQLYFLIQGQACITKGEKPFNAFTVLINTETIPSIRSTERFQHLLSTRQNDLTMIQFTNKWL